MGKLFTAHDPYNFHKTLGIVAVIHAVFRLTQIGTLDMGFDGSMVTALCMCWHTTLSCSSLLFRLPQKRMMAEGKGGSMIW
jgi:uncharacterized membrane protein YkgB